MEVIQVFSDKYVHNLNGLSKRVILNILDAEIFSSRNAQEILLMLPRVPNVEIANTGTNEIDQQASVGFLVTETPEFL